MSAKTDLEIRMRDLLFQYEQATTVNDLKVFCSDIDKAVEKLADLSLSDDQKRWEFPQKVEFLWRGQADYMNQLHRRRNKMIHEWVNDAHVTSLAQDYARFIQRAWPTLFGSPSAPPIDASHMNPAGQSTGSMGYGPTLQQEPGTNYQQTADPRHHQIPQTATDHRDPTQQFGRRPIKWSRLLLAAIQWAAAMWLVGLTLGLLARSSQVMILSGVVAAALAVFALRNLIGLMKSSGLVAALAAVLILAGGWWLLRMVLPGSMPLMTHGLGMTDPLLALIGETEIDNAGEAPVASPVRHTPTPGVGVIPAQDSATRVDAEEAPTRAAATQAPSGQPDAASATAPAASAGELAVGRRARVVTAGNRLNGRSAPSLAGSIEAAFDNGTELEVIDGPVTADGYTWWLVRGAADQGWSAADFLEPVP